MITRGKLLHWVEVQAEVDADSDCAPGTIEESIVDALREGGGFELRYLRHQLPRCKRLSKLLRASYCRTYDAAMRRYDELEQDERDRDDARRRGIALAGGAS